MGLLAITERGGIDFRTGEIRANVYALPGAEGVKIRAGTGCKTCTPSSTGKTGCKTCTPLVPEGGK